MGQRGRKSAAALATPAKATRARLEPPADLDAQEEEVFRQIVGDWPADHFRRSDLPVVSAYCRGIIFERRLGEAATRDSDHVKLWMDAARTVISLATKLRLTPQSRYDPKAVGRLASRTPGSDFKPPWE